MTAGHRDRGPDPVVRGDDDSGVAVEEVEPVVVAGQQQGPAGVPLLAPAAADRQAGVLGERALDEAVPVADAPGSVAMGAEQPVVRRGSSIASAASPRPPPSRRRSACRTSRSRKRREHRGVGRVEQLDVRRRPLVSRSRARSASPARTASARPPISGPKRWDVASAATVRGSRRVRPSTRSASTAPASTEASWSGIADEHQPAVGPHRLDQPGHHRQRHHRGLVDHDHVVRQPVAAVVAEPVAAAALPPEQPVQRLGRPAGRRRRGARRTPARPARSGRPPGAGRTPCRSAR